MLEDIRTTWFRCMMEPKKKKLIKWMEEELGRKVIFYRATNTSPGPGNFPQWTIEVTWRPIESHPLSLLKCEP